MPASIKYFAIVIVLGLFGCGSPANEEAGSSSNRSGDLLLIVCWAGIVTRPPFEVAFATNGQVKAMNRWLRNVPFWRAGSVISCEEADRLRQLLSEPSFASHRVPPLKDDVWEFFIITVEDGAKSSIFYIGWDRTTISLLTQLQSALGKNAAACLQRLIDDLERQEKNMKA
jgi:hypothetical protein